MADSPSLFVQQGQLQAAASNAAENFRSKRSNSEAFNDTEGSPDPSKSVKRLLKSEDLKVLGEFAEAVEELLSGCGQYYRGDKESPQLPGFLPQTSEAMTLCRGILNEAIAILKRLDSHNYDTTSLLNSISKALILEAEPDRRIGLIGDSGVGKSALINSLLDTPNLAHESANGEACTNVTIEYRKAWPNQRSAFQAEAHFYQWEEIECILKTSVESWFTWDRDIRPHVDGGVTAEVVHCTGNAHTDIDYDTQIQSKVQASTSFTIFRNLFLDHPEFETEEAGRSFLAEFAVSDEQVALDIMLRWTAALMSSIGESNYLVKRSAETVEGIAEHLRPYVTAMNERTIKPCPWPLIKVVRVGMRSSFLERGVVLVDLPGTSDVNFARASASANNRRGCDFHFVVTQSHRAETERSVHEALETGFNQLGSKVALICTRNEDIGHSATPQDMQASEEETQIFNSINGVTKDLNLLTSRVKVEISNLKGLEYYLAKDRLQALETCQIALAALRSECLIRMRNQKVTRNSQKSYQSQTSDQEGLQVYCVSNTQYRAHMEGYELHNMPASLDVVGIPAVRLSALALPSNDRFESVWNYWTLDMLEILAKIKGWCRRSAMPRQLDLRRIIEKELKVSQYMIIAFTKLIKCAAR